ncbi:hypothetical protein HDV01_003133 [Terramyces sp. JEL0728]|nr:hypothetical protein HDV01_003133 [Terramyces sp. JEL0728]
MNSTSQNSDAQLIDSAVIVFVPFIFIPVSILGFRLFKYFYRLYKAKLYGIEYAKEMLQNPLKQLGLRADEITTSKANRKRLKTQLKLELKNKIQKQESDSLLGRKVIAAEQYFEVLKTHSMKTWYDILSPSAVRTFLETSKYARWWMFLQLVVTILSIGNYISLTYLTNSNNIDGESIIKTMDMIYPIVIIIDYVLGFYISEDKLKFYCSPIALISLLSIVTPYVNLIAETPTKYIWLLGFVRIFRAIRLLKIYELLSYAQTETARQLTLFALNFFCFIFFSTSIINATEELHFALEDASMKHWHDALYYIIEIFSGTTCDLVPTNYISRAVMTVLILIAMVYIPMHVFKVIELFNGKNTFQRNPFRPKRGKCHVVVTGVLDYNSILIFSKMFFTFDADSTIVFLFDAPPTLKMRNLLGNPLYQSRIKYIQGDTLNLDDLNRAVVQKATALFVLGDNKCQKNGVYDNIETKLLQKAMFIKRNFIGIPIFAQVNELKSKAICKDYGVEVVVCLNELKGGLFASNCVYPGSQTLVTNLFQTFNNFDFCPSKEKWTKEYQCGLANQIHILKVPLGFVGCRYIVLVKEMYRSKNILIIGRGTREKKFIPNIKRGYILNEEDTLYCITDESEESLMQVGLEYEDKFQNTEKKHIHLDIDEIAKTSVISAPSISAPSVEFLHNPLPSRTNSAFNFLPEKLQDHIVLAGNFNVELVKIVVGKIKKWNAEIQILLVYSGSSKMDNSWKTIFSQPGVYVLTGHLCINAIVEKSNLKACKRLVLFSESTDPETILLVKLLQSYHPHVSMMVEVFDGSTLKYFGNQSWENDIEHVKTKTLLNSCSLNISERKFYYHSTRTRVEQESLLSRLFKFFFAKESLRNNDDSGEQSDVTDMFLKRMAEMSNSDEIGHSTTFQLESTFASGKTSTSTSSTGLLAHSYFKPYLTVVIKSLIDQIQLVRVETQFVGKCYLELFDKLIENGKIPLGLYRFNLEANYVYTNCRKGDTVCPNDQVYILQLSQ